MEDLILLENFIKEILLDEAKRKRKSKAKRKSSSKKIYLKKEKVKQHAKSLQLEDFQQRQKLL